MKLFKVEVYTSCRRKYELFILAGNDVEAKRIVEEESGIDIESFIKIELVDMKYPCLLCEIDITDR